MDDRVSGRKQNVVGKYPFGFSTSHATIKCMFVNSVVEGSLIR